MVEKKYVYNRHQLALSDEEEALLREAMTYKKMGISKTIIAIVREFVEAKHREELKKIEELDNRPHFVKLKEFFGLR